MTISIDNLNTLSDEEFVAMLGEVAEHSPWVVQRTAEKRPFTSVRGLHTAMMEVLGRASSREQMELICAHPDLAGKAARDGAMTDASVSEQAGAGLDRLSEAEFDRFHELNNAYRSKFGFPFIIAVKGHDKTSILEQFEERLKNDEDEERSEALRQIGDIIRYRLEDIVDHGELEDD